MVPTLMGYGLYNTSLKYLPSSVANLVVTIEPLLTAIFAYFLLGEMLTPVQLIGGALVLAGCGADPNKREVIILFWQVQSMLCT